MVRDEFRTIVSQLLGLAIDEVMMQSDFVEDLGADSLDLYQILLAVEERFDITLTAEDVQEIHTVAQAIAVIERYVA